MSNRLRGGDLNLRITEISSTADLQDASGLLALIWRPADPMPFEMLRLVEHIGGYVAAAYDGDEMIAASAGFPTAGGDLHSHILGVASRARGGGIGHAMKLHQRTWALDHGIERITWTFDPLTRRNAFFNLAKLAARVTTYHVDFYGDLPDELNAGDPSDRLLVTWELTAPEVVKATGGESRIVAEPGVAVLTEGEEGDPVVATGRPGGVFGIGTPTDVAELRRYRPDLANAWRQAQRRAIVRVLADGREVSGFSRSGYYVVV